MCIVGKDLLNSTHILTHPQGKKKQMNQEVDQNEKKSGNCKNKY